MITTPIPAELRISLSLLLFSPNYKYSSLYLRPNDITPLQLGWGERCLYYDLLHFLEQRFSSDVQISKDVVHRINLREVLIETFTEKSILSFDLRISVVDQRGKPEQGEGDGVARDIICGFFSKFVTSCALRCTEVPAIRHTMKKRHCKNVTCLMLYGLRGGYFPIRICPVFLNSPLFGEFA